MNGLPTAAAVKGQGLIRQPTAAHTPYPLVPPLCTATVVLSSLCCLCWQADLNGDGHLEVIIATHDYQLQVGVQGFVWG